MKLFIARLNYSTTEDTLRDLLEQVGPVESLKIIKDRDSGKSKGFGFVEMSNGDGHQAINDFDGIELDGRKIVVKEAEERGNRR